ncbi:MAG: hypothetical protein BMS9Abin20_0259 [Acidimicrobiia bacterium]|nr:MAG: hypothetical protein BMS9Abin20_0259 [Acidimicrobiia bacterium]
MSPNSAGGFDADGRAVPGDPDTQRKNTRDPRSYVRPRVPLAYAGLLIVALVSVIGFAAFSPSSSSTKETIVAPTTEPEPPGGEMSARVASAVLALRVSDAGSRTATTQATTDTTQNETTPDPAPTEGSEASSFQVTESAEPPSTTEPTTVTTKAPTPMDTTPPSIKVTSPKDGSTVTSNIVTFKGTTEPGALLRSGPFDAFVDVNGNWSLALVVVDGANGALFTAIDPAGNSADARITVYYNKPKTTTTTTHAAHTTTAVTHTDAPSTTTTVTHTDTTQPVSQPKWSPLWPADAGGIRDVEVWRPLVTKYWAADRVDCVLGIIKRESRGDPRAYNSATGASGLMQHLSKYWKGRAAAAGFRDADGLYASPYSAEANIAAGAYIAGSGSGWYTPWNRLPTYGSCSGS